MAGRLLFRYFYGLSQEKREWVNLAEVRAGQLPAPGAVDFQAVPLCLQKNAKGGENGTQLASLRQATHFLQRIFLRAKRKPAPSTQAVCARSFTGVCVGGSEGGGEREGCGGRKSVGGSQTMRGALWAPRHREVVGRALLSL